MSSHPGSTIEDAIELSLYLKDLGLNPEQVQDFYPTPGTASTVMYYTGINPLDGKKVYAPDDYREKLMQRALLQYKKPENRNLVREALKLANREDLIGFEGGCLVKPDMRVGSEFYEKNLKNQPKKQDKFSKNTKNKSQAKKNLSKNLQNKKGGKTLKNNHSPAQKSKFKKK